MNIRKYAIMFFSCAIALCFNACEKDLFGEDENDEPLPELPESGDLYVLSPSTQSAQSLPGKGTSDSPYLIRTAGELKLFADLVNNGEFNADNFGEYYGICMVKLMHDIEISEDYDWIPIGYNSDYFSVDFDGDNHEIKGKMKIGFARAVNSVGFFGKMDGHIHDLTISADMDIYRLDYNSYCGLLVGQFTGSLKNIVTSGAISINSGMTFNSFSLGKMVGAAYSWSSFENCISEGEMLFESLFPASSGVQGKNFRATQASIGGLVGAVIGDRTIDLQECYNNSPVIVENVAIGKELYVGGIIGCMSDAMRGNNGEWLIVENHGEIKVQSIARIVQDEVEPAVAVGGIYGYGRNRGGKIFNEGDITVESVAMWASVGGIAGITYNCDGGGTNNGSVTNRNPRGLTGGCFGYAICEIEDASNLGDVTSTATISEGEGKNPSGWTGGIAGLNTEWMKDCLNSGNVFSSGVFDYDSNGIPVSYGGAIIGKGKAYVATCDNYGIVDGCEKWSNYTPMYVGFVWRAWEMLLYDEITDQNLRRVWIERVGDATGVDMSDI